MLARQFGRRCLRALDYRGDALTVQHEETFGTSKRCASVSVIIAASSAASSAARQPRCSQ